MPALGTWNDAGVTWDSPSVYWDGTSTAASGLTITWKVELGITKTLTGMLVLDTSTVGGTDVFDGFFYGYEKTDITDHVRNLSISRGRSDDLQAVVASTLSMELVDTDERFNPQNPAGTYYPNLRPMMPVWVTATWKGVPIRLYTGWVDSWDDAGWALDGYTCSVQAVDALALLERIKPRFDARYPASVADAIHTVLDYSGWPEPDRQIATDVTTSVWLPTAQGESSALQLLQELTDEVGGILYQDGAGTLIYESSDAETDRTVDLFQLDSGIQSLRLPIQASDIVNQLAWTFNDPVSDKESTGTVLDPNSQAIYGVREGSGFSTKYLRTKTDVIARAKARMAGKTAPRPRASVHLVSGSQLLIEAMLTTRLLDRIRIREAVGTNTSYHVQQIDLSADASTGVTSADWQLTRRMT